MINIKRNIELASYTTFRLGGKAKYFCEIELLDDLNQALDFAQENKLPIFVLGGGSNVLLSDKGFSGLVLKNHLKGIEIVKNEKKTTLIRAASGESWGVFGGFCLKHELYGLENLLYIPGTVGGAVIGNIGAYGVEQQDCFVSLKVLDLKKRELITLSKSDCRFAYRYSIFKDEKNIGRYFVISADYNLSKNFIPKLSYSSLKESLPQNPSINDLLKSIATIRGASLPGLDVFYSAGSFFKNPEVKISKLKLLLKEFPDIKYFGLKISAGWLIEDVGFKGFSYKNAYVSPKHALILGNNGKAKSAEVLYLKTLIQKAVWKKFAIILEPEVLIIENK
jgi:UDP-N-acetylmuramate dehydrogenase